MSHFEEAVALVLKAEGGLLISDSEHGGGANFGVSLLVLQEHRKNNALTLDDLRALTIEEAKEIYRERFWNRFAGDQLTGRLTAIAMLDQAVNRGVAGMNALMAKTLAKLGKTHANECEDRDLFFRFVMDGLFAYEEVCADDPKKAKWLKGWTMRCKNLLKLLV